MLIVMHLTLIIRLLELMTTVSQQNLNFNTISMLKPLKIEFLRKTSVRATSSRTTPLRTTSLIIIIILIIILIILIIIILIII